MIFWGGGCDVSMGGASSGPCRDPEGLYKVESHIGLLCKGIAFEPGAIEVFFLYPSRLLFIFHCCLSLPYQKGRTTA